MIVYLRWQYTDYRERRGTNLKNSSNPNSVQNVYFSIISDHDYVIKYRHPYLPKDKKTVSNCKEISEYKIFSRNQPNIKLLESETCEATLLKRYVNNKCKNLPASRAHFRPAQLASLASLNAPRARSVLSGPRASRSVLCSLHTFKFIYYNLILKLKPIL